TARSKTPAVSSLLRVCFHVFPPSADWKTPRAVENVFVGAGREKAFTPVELAPTITTSGLCGLTMTDWIKRVFSRPAWVQVLPSSADLYMPLPGVCSPVPA